MSERGTNEAGIDLGEKVYSLLGMAGNTDAEWEFVQATRDAAGVSNAGRLMPQPAGAGTVCVVQVQA